MPIDESVFTVPAGVFVAASVNDNTGSVSLDPQSTHDFPVGMHSVTLVARDSSDNTASCQFELAIIDIDPPRFVTCPVLAPVAEAVNSETIVVVGAGLRLFCFFIVFNSLYYSFLLLSFLSRNVFDTSDAVARACCVG